MKNMKFKNNILFIQIILLNRYFGRYESCFKTYFDIDYYELVIITMLMI